MGSYTENCCFFPQDEARDPVLVLIMVLNIGIGFHAEAEVSSVHQFEVFGQVGRKIFLGSNVELQCAEYNSC